MDTRNITKPSQQFIDTYYTLLCGIEEGVTETIIANKHAGLAILRVIESLNYCHIILLSRDMFTNAMRAANAEHLIPQHERSFSRLQFVIVTNKNTGNRFLIDLGSYLGTTLLNCQTKNTDDKLKKIAKELNFFLIKAETNCLTDNIHGKMYSPYQSIDKRKSITISLNESAKAALPNPNQDGEIFLQSGLNGYKWYPLLQQQQDIRIGDNMFILNADSTLTFKKRPESIFTIIPPSTPKAAPAQPAFLGDDYVLLPIPRNSTAIPPSIPKTAPTQPAFLGEHYGLLPPPRTATAIPSSTPKAAPSQPAFFDDIYVALPPKTSDSNLALIANFNKLLSANSHGVNGYNFAVNNVIEQIKQAGGIEKMKGYPEAFKCPITQEPMRNPLIDTYGHTYEASVTETLRRSPITNLNYPIGHQFKPNTELKVIIDLFFKIKGVDRNAPIMTIQTDVPRVGKM